MAAGGIGPLEALALSVIVLAGASMLAAMQLLAADAPVAIIVLTALFINLRFMMYSASLRRHLVFATIAAGLAALHLFAWLD